jgi:osmoprotectant transport system permease protein
VNRALLLLLLLAALGVALLGFVSFAPNRLLSGQPVPLWQTSEALVGTALLLAVLAAVALRPTPRLHWLVLGASLAALVALPLAAGRAASSLMAGAAPAARVGLGGAFWILVLVSALAAVDAAQRLALPALRRSALALLPAAGLAALAFAGAFDDLSLAREYANRREVFASELLRHVLLVAAAVALATAIGMPLALVARGRPRLSRPMFGMLNLLQTVPSVALFGLLIGPLSALARELPFLQALGIRGIGTAPALVALVLYSLLPIARNTLAGVENVPAATTEAARAMGMRPLQVLLQVELPLAWPVLLAGLRIVTVQAVGLAVVAALIGAGGLGSFVFQGLGQNALDLVLLGALATIALALAADLGFAILIAARRA